jgi:hypothetical protein
MIVEVAARDLPGETRRQRNIARIKVTTPAPRDVWTALLAQDQSALVMQTPEWFDCICASREYSDASRLYEFTNGRRLVLPLVHGSLLGGGRAKTAHSPPSSWGFGGVVADRPIAPGDLEAVFADVSTSSALRTTLLSNPDQAAEWAAGAPAWVRTIHRTAHVLDLDGGFERVWSERFPSATRTKIRKAERSGVVARSNAAFLSIFYDIYVRWSVEHGAARGIPARLAKLRAEHREPMRKFMLLARALGEKFRIWVAFVDGSPAAALILLVDGEDAIYWRGYSVRALTRTSRASDLLQQAAIEDACSAGCLRYHMGESSNVASLMHFKERFGARPVAYAQYRLEKVPLTPIEDAWGTVVHGVERAVLALRRS